MMQKIFTILLALIIGLSLTTMSFAANQAATSKLDRGLKNVAFGWTDIPKTIVDTSKKDGALIGLTGGLIKGVFNAFARTLSGAVDTLTFTAGTHEGPILKPSMVPEGSGAAAVPAAKATK